MTTYELVGYSTERAGDVRWRSYTRSAKTAVRFASIPRIDFTDSGHGIIFHSRPLAKGERRGPPVRIVSAHVRKHMGKGFW